MKLSIVILTWNNINTLAKTLAVIKDIQDKEVIIVDNGSTDGCAQLATIANKDNMGVSFGKNQGIDKSKGDYIFILDGDIVPVKNSIKCLMNFLDSNPNIDAIGIGPNKFTRCEKDATQYCERLENIKENTCSNLYYGMFRRKVFDSGLRMETSGPFMGVGYGWEERDFFMQMKQAGIKQYIADINDSTGKYFHDINSSIREMGQDKYVSSSKERHEYFKKKWKI